MKCVLLAGGYGTRISEESATRPKPMVEIGGRPILWHIMKTYAAHEICDFIVCCGYKGYQIKEYFANYFLHQSDVTIDLSSNSIQVHQRKTEPWRVTLVDTGENTQTGGRLKRIAEHLSEDFCLTYGDGVGDVNISELIRFHKNHGREGTVTAVRPPGRFGALELCGGHVTSFHEKPQGDGGWVNGGFFVLSPSVLRHIDGDETVFEKAPLEALARDNQLQAYFHKGFWQPMDTLRDKNMLESLWVGGSAPWKVWS